jgi:hypothetical protein
MRESRHSMSRAMAKRPHRRGAAGFAVAPGAERGFHRLGPGARGRPRRRAGWPFARRVESAQDFGQAGGDLGARHAALQRRIIVGAQDQHVEAGQHGLEVVVVEDRVVQSVEVVQRPKRLCDLLVHTVADLLWTDIAGDEHGDPLAAVKRCPVQPRAAAIGPELRPAADPGDDETGGMGHHGLHPRPVDEFHGHVGRRARGLPDVDPCLVAQPRQQDRQVHRHAGRYAARDRQGDRPLEPGQRRQFAPAFHPETQLDEIARDLGVGTGRRAGAVTANSCIGGKTVGDHARRSGASTAGAGAQAASKISGSARARRAIMAARI